MVGGDAGTETGDVQVPLIDHGEASMEVRRRDVGNTREGRSAGGSGNSVRNDLYRDTAGNRGTMGGITPTIWSVCNGEGVRRGWEQGGGLVAPRGDRETTLGHPGRNIAGG